MANPIPPDIFFRRQPAGCYPFFFLLSLHFLFLFLFFFLEKKRRPIFSLIQEIWKNFLIDATSVPCEKEKKVEDLFSLADPLSYLILSPRGSFNNK